MLQLKLSIRRLLRNRIISSFSILGFFLSFLLLIVIIQYVVSELKVDKFHENSKNLYSISVGGDDTWIPVKLIERLQDEPLIEKIIPYGFAWNGVLVKNGENEAQFVESIFVDSNFFDSFSFQFIAGDRKNCMNHPFSAVLTQSEAKKIFGADDPIGKVITFNKKYALTINGIIKDYPKNSIFRSQCFISFKTLKILSPFTFNCEWSCNNVSAFALLNNPEHKDLIAAEIQKIYDAEDLNGEVSPNLISLNDTYFDKNIEIRDELNKGNLNRVYVFGLLGILILIVAAFNYLNFLVSNVIDKQQGNATLKVFGGKYIHFFKNYLADTMIVFSISLFLSYGFYYAVLQNMLIQFNLFQWVEPSKLALAIPFVFALVISIISAFLAALWIKRETLVQFNNSRNNLIRKSILVIQFCSVIFLAGTCLLVNKQINYMQHKSLGFAKENLICINTSNIIKTEAHVLRNELMKISGIKDVCFSDAIPGKATQGWGTIIKVNGEEKQVNFGSVPAESHFLKTYNFKLVQGRFYSDTIPSDISNAVINESAAKSFGWENPIGKTLLDGWFDGKSKGIIVGVVEDFHFSSMHSKIGPFALINQNKYNHYITLKIGAGFSQQKQIISQIEDKWKILEPGIPFNWFYFDSHLNNLYKSEVEFGHLTIWLTVFAIIITFLGLIGMIMFIIKQRMKEIGVRKVNGARILEIIKLFNTDFLKWVFLSIVIASPIVFWFLNKWLQNFAYQTQLSWWIFVLSGLIALGISIITVSWQTFRAARKNPVEALRYE